MAKKGKGIVDVHELAGKRCRARHKTRLGQGKCTETITAKARAGKLRAEQSFAETSRPADQVLPCTIGISNSHEFLRGRESCEVAEISLWSDDSSDCTVQQGERST